MKPKLSIILALLLISFQTIMAQENNKRIVIAYFSATGTTEQVAKKLAAVSNGELFEIVPSKAYTDADLDWNDKKSRSSLEMNDAKSRPQIKSKKEYIADYDVVIIGYPIWWDLAPRVINTFIESHDLKGKTIIPFATSGGSSIAGSVTALKKSYPGLKWKPGRLLNRADENTIRAWFESVEY